MIRLPAIATRRFLAKAAARPAAARMRRQAGRLLLACGLGAWAAAAQAHYLWIERAGPAVRVYFGEYEEAVHEHSPGRLDEIPGPRLRRAADGTDGAGSDLPLARAADGFRAAPDGAPRTGLVLIETGVPVKDWSASGIGVVKPMYYARHASGAAAVDPVLPLDVVPTGRAGAFRVTFRGEPLAKAKVTVVAPNGWSQEAGTDADGRLALALPWRGQYLVQAVHREPAPGEHAGARYEAVRHRMVLTIDHPSGAATFTPRFAR